jgi:hypothetical protein
MSSVIQSCRHTSLAISRAWRIVFVCSPMLRHSERLVQSEGHARWYVITIRRLWSLWQ